jgi:6,7-dimethyl-8-ribityllumazine synthase
LGCVIRGETSHYDIVAGESARGLIDLSLTFSLAIGNGILTCDNRDQAWERAAVDRKNKGGFAAGAALDMVEIKRTMGLFPR